MKLTLALMLMPLLSAISWGAYDSVLTLDRVEAEVTDRIQTGVLNPILGAGKSSAFVKLTLAVKTEVEDSRRSGEGAARTRIAASPSVTASSGSFSGFALDLSTAPRAGDGERTQESRQTKGLTNERTAVLREFEAFKIVILYDENILPKALDDVRRALLAIYGPELKIGDIRFQSASFSPSKP